MSAYDLTSLELPRLKGASLALFVSALESRAGRALLTGKLLRDAGVEQLRALSIAEAPTFLPISRDHRGAGKSPIPPLEQIKGARSQACPLHTIRDFAEAYHSGRSTPERVVGRLLNAIEESRSAKLQLGAVVSVDVEGLRDSARLSSARIKAGSPLSPLDGVPIGVKDELDQRGLPTTVGTGFMGREVAREDATVVARLRAAGALLFGKLNMNEIGINPDGGNMNHGLVRNPHDLSRDTGGSSSGSAAAVAAGLCPAALGADGGGSIRIPAALCGVTGLKASFGRISEHGAAPLCWSVAHVGPLAATVEDLALIYAVIAGADPADLISELQPPPSLEGWSSTDLRGLRIGVYPPWFEHAAPAVVERCHAALGELTRAGAQVRQIELGGLNMIRVAHAVTILSEMSISMERFRNQGELPEFALPTRVNLAIARAFSAGDYLKAQQVRTRALAELSRVLEQVDLIATPTCAITAPLIPVDDAKDGWSDLSSTTEVMRFAFVANLSGLPAITVPVGQDGNDLPIGLHLMGRAWSEHLLLRAAHAIEQRIVRQRAQLQFDLLT